MASRGAGVRWELADEQEMFRDALADWLGHFASTDAVREWLDSGDPAGFEQELVAADWFGVGSPEEWGGQGGGLLELALTAEQLGRAAAPSSAWMASALAVPALAGVPDLAADILRSGRYAALAVSADRPPDEPAVLRCPAPDSITGEVCSVLGADRAKQLVVPAETGTGRALFLVEVDDPGVRIASRKLLDRSRSVADVALNGAAARKLDVDGEQVLASAALRAAVLVAADSLGATDRMLNLAVDYSKQRKQFGVPIGSFQAVKHTAAEMLVSVESARSIAYFAAESVQEGQSEAALHAAAAKAQVTPAGEQAADRALTMHGAVGYTWEHDLHLFYKRTKLNKRLFGAPEVWNERLASALRLVSTG